MTVQELVKPSVRRLVSLVTYFSKSRHAKDVIRVANFVLENELSDLTVFRIALKYLASYARLCWADLSDEEEMIIGFLEGVNKHIQQYGRWEHPEWNPETDVDANDYDKEIIGILEGVNNPDTE